MNAFRVWLRVCQLALLTVVILGVASRGLAMQELPPQIGVLVTCFSTNTEQVDSLLSQHRRDGDDAALRTAVQGLVEAGKAELNEIAYGSTRSGFPMKVESVVERLYPTENDPGEIPQELRGPIQAATRLTSHATPTAFLSRPTGSTLQVTPQGGSHGRLIALNFNLDGWEHVNDDVHSQVRQKCACPFLMHTK